MSARENILKKIKKALREPVAQPFPQIGTDLLRGNFEAPSEDLSVLFAQNLIRVQGQFQYCSTLEDFVKKLTDLLDANAWNRIYCREPVLINKLQQQNFHRLAFSHLKDAPAAITYCEALVARTGSILLSSAQQSGRTTSVYTPVHICVAYTSQLVYDIEDGLHLLQDKYDCLPSMISLASGPSRTADIEKTLVVGIHGPRQVICFLIED